MSFEDENEVKSFEILLLGESWTGKSNIFSRIVRDTFDENSYGTIGIHYSKKSFNLISNILTSVIFWDVSGRRSYWDISIASLRNVHGIILVYDITKRETFEAIESFWKEKINQYFPRIPILLLGNKMDLEEYRTVSVEEAETFAIKSGISFHSEVSAKDGKGILESLTSFLSVLRVVESFEVATRDDLSQSYQYHETLASAAKTPPTPQAQQQQQSQQPQQPTQPATPNSHLLEFLFGQENKEMVIEHITYDKQRKEDHHNHNNHNHHEDILSEEETEAADDEEKKYGEIKLPHNPLLSNHRFQESVPLSLSGMAGGYGSLVNGIYLPTSQFEDNWPVYRKAPQDHNGEHNQEMFLCFQAYHKRKRRLSSSVSAHSAPLLSPAWVIRNKGGKVYARLVLHAENKEDLESDRFAIDKIQLTEKGKRKDLQWEMKSSVGVLGFRKRPAAVIRPASMIQLKLLPEMKDGSLDLCRNNPLETEEDKISHPPTSNPTSNPTSPNTTTTTTPSSNSNTIYRVILLGESGVGKTNLIKRYHERKYQPNLPRSVSVDITPTEVDCLDGRHLKCHLWDTSGDYAYWKLVSLYLSYPLGGVAGVLLVYDISNRDSFLMIETWIERLQSLSIFTPMILHLIGTKSDLDDFSERRVSFEEGIALAEKYFMSSFVETSAHDGTGVIEAFQQILTDLICFDDNAKQWIKTTKPTYRRRRRTIAMTNNSTTTSPSSSSPNTSTPTTSITTSNKSEGSPLIVGNLIPNTTTGYHDRSDDDSHEEDCNENEEDNDNNNHSQKLKHLINLNEIELVNRIKK